VIALGALVTGVDPFGVIAPLVRARSEGAVAEPIGIDDLGAFAPFVSRRGARASLVVPPIGVEAFAEKLRCVGAEGT
jgi:hypothetical protein